MNKTFIVSLALLSLVLVACPATKPDTKAPVVSITSPKNDAVVNSQLTMVQGTVQDDSKIKSVTIQLNDGSAKDITNTLSKGNFSVSVEPLKGGNNTIIVTAQDNYGNSQSVTVNVVHPIKTGVISGEMWLDANKDGKKDEGEEILKSHTVFLDENNNQILDDGEMATKTNTQGEYVFNGLTLGETYHINQVLKFGQRFSQEVDLQPQIVGGIDTDIGDFPFMVALGYDVPNQGFVQICGSSLISSKFILTAAHCVAKIYDPAIVGPLSVLVATDDLDNGSGTIIPVENITIHPKYEPKNIFAGNDVAVLELTRAVDLSGHAYTIEMLSKKTLEFAKPSTVTTAIGWGLLSQGGEAPSHLQMVHTKVIASDDCTENLAHVNGQLRYIPMETVLCTNVDEGGIGVCNGDSGGLLMVRGDIAGEERWFHAGITSWGIECGSETYPHMFARTSALQSWIVQQAIDTSASINVRLDEENSQVTADFANQASVRPFINKIAPRWQPTNFVLTSPNQADFFVEANKDISVEWNIFAEDTAEYNYNCTLSFQVSTSDAVTTNQAPMQSPMPISCGLGVNSYTFEKGISNGIGLIELNVIASDGKQYSRKQSVGLAGFELSEKVTKTDPAVFGQGHVDIFALTDVAVGDSLAVAVEEPGFLTIQLYKKNNLEPDLKKSLSLISSSTEPNFIKVEADTTYLVAIGFEEELDKEIPYSLLSTNGQFVKIDLASLTE